jgi:6-phosphogluconolactonase
MNVQMNLKAGIVAALSCLCIGAPASAATFVYVSNNEDGNIGMYTLRPDGSLQPGQPVAAAGKVVMPMTVSPDKRFLVAAIRSKPFSTQTYSVDAASGKLTFLGSTPTEKQPRGFAIDPNWVEIVSFD